ncbi:LamG domain-containing protein [Crocosphaera sp. Alani8]|uniref:LamG domain-containing protein n=1 Tax=Crocosphaera sp. Alani8 TaxID=3038952 RepID=UPI00313AC55E
MTTLPNINIKGLLWQAEARVIRLEGPLNKPDDDNWTLRNLWVEKNNNIYNPSTIIALCWISKVVIQPVEGKKYTWTQKDKPPQDGQPPYEPKPSLEEIEEKIQSGEYSLLLLQTDPQATEWSNPNQIPECTCIAGDIYLTEKFESQDLPNLYNALGLIYLNDFVDSQLKKREGSSQLLAPISVHSSGLTIFAQVKLPWQEDNVKAPFQLTPLIKDGLATSVFRLKPEQERLQKKEKENWIEAWQRLSDLIDPLANIIQPQEDELQKYPNWLTLKISNPEIFPPIYWQIDQWSDSDEELQLLTVSFEQNAFSLIFSDQSLYDQDSPPNSLAQVAPLIVISKAEDDSLIITIDADKNDNNQNDTNQNEDQLIYEWSNTNKEFISLSNLTTSFSPTQIPQFLRDNQGLNPPQWLPKLEDNFSDTETIKPSILWGFMPLGNGSESVQLPIPNLTEQIYLDADLANSTLSQQLNEFSPASQSIQSISLFQGAVSFGNERESLRANTNQLDQEIPWNITLTDAKNLSGTWKLEKKADSYEVQEVKLTINKPICNIRGLCWLNTGQPTVKDAIPDLSNWISSLESIPLKTIEPKKDIFPPVIELIIENLTFSPQTIEIKENNQEINTLAGDLGAWQFSYQVNIETFKKMIDKRILPKDTFQNALKDELQDELQEMLPLVWLKHPSLPMIQAFPMTQNQSPADYPSASRQLIPYELPIKEIDNKIFVPDLWRFGIGNKEVETKTKGALNWARYLSPLNPAQEWKKLSNLPVVSLSLSGLVLSPNKNFLDAGLDAETQLYLQYRLDLPYTDEINGLAQLPKASPQSNTVSPLPNSSIPEPVKPLERETFAEHWQQLSQRASLASADAIFALNKSKDKDQTFVENLIEPLLWEVKAKFDLDRYPGSLTLANANDTETIIKLESNQALEGITGEFVRNNGNIELINSDDDTSSYTITAGSMNAQLENNQIRDQRGLSHSVSTTPETEVNKTLLTTIVSLDNTDYELITTLEVLNLVVGDRSWRFWFKNLPFKENQFDREITSSLQTEDINDPEAQSRKYNFLNGYEWRLSDTESSVLPFKFFGLDFYPLMLKNITKTEAKVEKIEIIGRLQLPFKNEIEQENLSNAVVIKFQWQEEKNQYIFDDISIAPSSEDSFVEWTLNFLTPDNNKEQVSSPIPELEWKKIEKQANRIKISELILKFHLFKTNWIIPLTNQQLIFPNPNPISYGLPAENDFSLIQISLDINPQNTQNLQLEFSVKIGDRSKDITIPDNNRITEGLQALYTFREGNGDTIRDVSNSINPLNLKIKNTDADDIEWLEGGGVKLKKADNIISSIDPAKELSQAFQKTNEITLEAWIQPQKKEQSSARIITFSLDKQNRNFTLSQGVNVSGSIAVEYNVRLRHTEADNDGLPAVQSKPDVVVIDEPSHLVYTRTKGEVKIYLNGEEIDPQRLIESEGNFSNWNDNYIFALGNEITEDRGWLGTYYLVAVYDRVLTPSEVKLNYQEGYLFSQPTPKETPEPPSQEAIAFQTKFDYDLVEQQIQFSNSKLFDDLDIKIEAIDEKQFFANNAFQVRWQKQKDTISSSTKPIYLLPGIPIQSEDTSGYAVFTFTPQSQPENIPILEINSATVEALMFARWGDFLQEQEQLKENLNNRKKQIFNSSAGDLIIGYTGQLIEENQENQDNQQQGRNWQESLLLNGMIELKNLISWPQQLEIKNTKITLPAINSIERVSKGLQAMYIFSEGKGDTIFDRSGSSNPLNLKITNTDSEDIQWLEGGGLKLTTTNNIISSINPAKQLTEACKKTNEITLEAWIQPKNKQQISSIVTLSKDLNERNFTLSQGMNVSGSTAIEYNVRLRHTAVNNPENGLPAIKTKPDAVVIDEPSHLVYTRTKGEVKIYLNGEEIEPSISMSQGKVTASVLNFRSSPVVESGNEIGELQTDNVVDIIKLVEGGEYPTDDGIRSDWYQIEFNSKEGFVAAALIKYFSVQSEGDFSNWNDDYIFALGNEITEDRGWLGSYYLVAIYDRALSKDEIEQNYQAGYLLPINPLNHIRHTSKILFNQHQIPANSLFAGTNDHLFNFRPLLSWSFLAVVEHQLINVLPDFQSGKLELKNDRRWTNVQRIEIATPNQLRKKIRLINQDSIRNPMIESKKIEINFDYLFSQVRSSLTEGENSALAKLPNNILLIEATTPIWINQEALNKIQSPISLQFLPNGNQKAIISSLQDYQSSNSNPTEPKWLMLIMPFLGRLQSENEDRTEVDIDNALVNTLNPLQVDPILHLEYLRAFNFKDKLPLLSLGLSHWADSTPFKLNVSGFDTIIGKQWSRLDPISIEESWFRIQTPPPERLPKNLSSIVAAFPDNSARLSRNTALQNLFTVERLSYPPQENFSIQPNTSKNSNLINTFNNFLLLHQGVIPNLSRSEVPPYGWLLSGILLTQGLLNNRNNNENKFNNRLDRHVSTSIFPARLKSSKNQPNPFPQTLAISPYIGFQRENISGNISRDLRLIVTELLCINPIFQILEPVDNYTWESQKFTTEIDFIKFLQEQTRDLAQIRQRFKENGIILSEQDSLIEVEYADNEGKITDRETGLKYQIRSTNQQIIFYQNREMIVELAKSWGQQIKNQLYPQSNLAVLRLRELYQNTSRETAISSVAIEYSFELISIEENSMLEIKNTFALRSPLQKLNFRETQFNIQSIPKLENIKNFEIAPPLTVGVQSIHLQPSKFNPWGLSALRLSVNYTEKEKAIAFSSSNLSEQTLWWQGCQHQVQFRSAKTAGDIEAVAGLPPLFRASAIKNFLPTLSNLPLPNIDNFKEEEQSILPGSIQSLLIGNRQGVMLAIRNQIISQPLTQSSPALVSASIPVQHRMPRPVILPDYQTIVEQVSDRAKEKALQTWGSYFQPEQRLIAKNFPTNEAFYGECGDLPAQSLQIKLIFPEYGTILDNWDGKLTFEVTINSENSDSSTWHVENLYIIDSNSSESVEYDLKNPELSDEANKADNLEPLSIKRSQGLNFDFQPKDTDTDRSNLSSILNQKSGSLVTVQLTVYNKKNENQERFPQVLSFPLRIGSKFARPLTLEPYFIHFEDPEYNRLLASASGNISREIKLKEKELNEEESNDSGENTPKIIPLTLSVDRQEYNPDSLLYYRIDWDIKNQDFDFKNNATTINLEFKKISDTGIKIPLQYQESEFKEVKEGQLFFLRLNELVETSRENSDASNNLKVGDTLEISIVNIENENYEILEEQVDDKLKEPIVLAVTIVAKPVNPSSQAAYGLLRSYEENDDSKAVECVRFAWNPQAESIELVCAEDLRTGVVRRRAIFRWQDSAKIKDTRPIYDIQKITENGSTHIIGFAEKVVQKIRRPKTSF